MSLKFLICVKLLFYISTFFSLLECMLNFSFVLNKSFWWIIINAFSDLFFRGRKLCMFLLKTKRVRCNICYYCSLVRVVIKVIMLHAMKLWTKISPLVFPTCSHNSWIKISLLQYFAFPLNFLWVTWWAVKHWCFNLMQLYKGKDTILF